MQQAQPRGERSCNHNPVLTVLSDCTKDGRTTLVTVDLDQLWRELGVQVEPRGIGIDPGAPLAEIRKLHCCAALALTLVTAVEYCGERIMTPAQTTL